MVKGWTGEIKQSQEALHHTLFFQLFTSLLDATLSRLLDAKVNYTNACSTVKYRGYAESQSTLPYISTYLTTTVSVSYTKVILMRPQLLASSHTFELFHKSTKKQQVPKSIFDTSSISEALADLYYYCDTRSLRHGCRIRLPRLTSPSPVLDPKRSSYCTIHLCQPAFLFINNTQPLLGCEVF